MIGSHCVIPVHRQALSSKTLPQNLRDSLSISTKIDLDSNHKVLLFHSDIRWISKGNMSARLYEPKQEVKLFLDHQNKQELLQMFEDEKFQLSLGCLADIFEFLNNLILKPQGRNTTILANYDHIQGFLARLKLWPSRVSSANMASFTRLDESLKTQALIQNHHLGT
nr:unnamed protein product [Callosobruchus analis]